MTGIRVEGWLRADRKTWADAWARSDSATFFHSPMWPELWSALSATAEPECLSIGFSDGARAYLVGLVRPSYRRTVRWRQSSAAGTYGGWFSDLPLSGGHGVLLSDFLTRHWHDFDWRINPFDSSQQPLPAERFDVAPDVTYVVDLRRPFAEVVRRWSKGHRSAAQKGSRSGVVVSQAATLDEWCAYFDLYQASLSRWGDSATSNYPWSLFESLHDLGRQSGSGVALWLAYIEGQPVAGALCFSSSSHVSYWHGAANPQYFPSRAVHKLLHDAMYHYVQLGYSWFDMNPSGGHDGVAKFKRGFGATALDCPIIRATSLRRRILHALTRNVLGLGAAKVSKGGDTR